MDRTLDKLGNDQWWARIRSAASSIRRATSPLGPREAVNVVPLQLVAPYEYDVPVDLAAEDQELLMASFLGSGMNIDTNASDFTADRLIHADRIQALTVEDAINSNPRSSKHRRVHITPAQVLTAEKLELLMRMAERTQRRWLRLALEFWKNYVTRSTIETQLVKKLESVDRTRESAVRRRKLNKKRLDEEMRRHVIGLRIIMRVSRYHMKRKRDLAWKHWRNIIQGDRMSMRMMMRVSHDAGFHRLAQTMQRVYDRERIRKIASALLQWRNFTVIGKSRAIVDQEKECRRREVEVIYQAVDASIHESNQESRRNRRSVALRTIASIANRIKLLHLRKALQHWKRIEQCYQTRGRKTLNSNLPPGYLHQLTSDTSALEYSTKAQHSARKSIKDLSYMQRNRIDRMEGESSSSHNIMSFSSSDQQQLSILVASFEYRLPEPYRNHRLRSLSKQ
jgi:hypothetical protein